MFRRCKDCPLLIFLKNHKEIWAIKLLEFGLKFEDGLKGIEEGMIGNK